MCIVDIAADVATTSSVQAEKVFNHSNEVILENSGEELDQSEAEKDKLVEKVIIDAVPPSDCRQAIQTVKEVEEDIRSRFLLLGVDVKDIQMKTSRSGKYESSLVEISPINLRKIWGRRLSLRSCAVVEYKQS